MTWKGWNNPTASTHKKRLKNLIKYLYFRRWYGIIESDRNKAVKTYSDNDLKRFKKIQKNGIKSKKLHII